MAFVARQGHQQVDSLDDWSILRFNRLYQAICRQLQQEAESAERARQEMAMRDSSR